MRKKQKSKTKDELRREYDLHKPLKGGVKGKHAERYGAGTNLVRLDPDVAKAFAYNAEMVNETLRLVIELTKLPRGKKQQSAKP